MNEVYTAFIEGELKTERERRTTLDGRGAAVVTQSGGLVTLMTGVAAFVKGTAPQALPPFAAMALILALVFFVGAAVCGILVTFAHAYPPHSVADEATMQRMRNEKRDHSDEEARTVVSYLHEGTVASLRKGNDRKVNFLTWAQGFQILALLTVSMAVFVQIVRS